ncbi:MAG TPA: DUF3090 family protein [Actinomycetota bacterium]|nr:DUF3090 family protein [Actinomycetota bacterium]
MLIELDPVERITAGAVGPPGQRVFYLQGRRGDQLVTLLVEKQQVQLLAASVVEILARVGKETGQGPPEEEMALDEPLVAEWRAGRLSIGYHEERDLLMLEAEELLDEEEGGEEGTPEDETEEEDASTTLGSDIAIAGLGELEGNGEMDEATDESGEDEDEELDALAEGLGSIEGLEELEAATAREPARIRFWATREQMLSLARHGALVCAAGRPLCQLCRNPLDPEGHLCPALNGHREMGSE